MVRAIPNGGGTLRNRKITNKSRLKILRGEVDDLEELQEESANHTAGVDEADAHEHHLQAALSSSSKLTKFIPTPDSTGIVPNFEELYATRTWTDDVEHNVYSLDTDQSVSGSLQEGFTYYMDERDKQWLDKNNEEARGEGTSASASRATPGSARTTPRGKGKHAITSATDATSITEDEFELVMGVLERVTHEKTAYLHHSFDPAVSFPAFADYQETFSTTLPVTFFHAYSPPSWVPAPPELTLMARIVYPHWKARRIDRGGHRIIPCLNYDESDTVNESFICFRRREIKAARKTRASQLTSNDKLLRLHAELIQLEDIARLTHQREVVSLESTRNAQDVWQKRLAVVDTLRKNPSFYNKQDDDIYLDKERVVKKPRVENARLKIRAGRDNQETPGPLVEIVRPKERLQLVQMHIDRELARMKEEDKQWDDQADNPYQTQPVPYASRLHKYISSLEIPSRSSGGECTSREARSVRMRYGRGGRMHVDRRISTPRYTSPLQLHALAGIEDHEDDDRARGLLSRWRFDTDDLPIAGPEGEQEKDRMLVDEHTLRYTAPLAGLFHGGDLSELMTNSELTLTHPDGRLHIVQPLKSVSSAQRMRPPPPPLQSAAGPPTMPVANVKRTQALIPNGMRIPSNGPARPISAMMMGGAPPYFPSHGEVIPKHADSYRETSPVRPRSQNQHHAAPAPNGNIYPPKSSYTLPADGQWLPHQQLNAQQAHLLSLQQKQQGVKVLQQPPSGRPDGRPNYGNYGLQQSANMNLKLPPARAMQWAGGRGQQQQTPPSGGESLSPHQFPPRTHPSPTRVPATPTMPHISPSMQHQQAV